METYMVYIWLAVIVLTVIAEAVTYELISVWFAVGSLAALVANVFGAEIWLQIVIAAVVSLVLVICTRPFVNKMLKTKKTSTNADRYIGQTGMVIEEIDNSKPSGLVRVKGSIWTARTEDDKVVPSGDNVKILRIEGVKLIVGSAAD